MDSLIAIGTGSAFLYSLFAMGKIYLGDTTFVQSLYFESASVVVALVMLGKYLEARSKGKTSEAIKKLMQLKPKTAIIEKNGQEIGNTPRRSDSRRCGDCPPRFILSGGRGRG